MDVINLIAEKCTEYYDTLLNEGYVMVGDNYIAIELKKQLNVSKIDYFVLTHLSVQYFLINLDGALKLKKILKNVYEKTRRTQLVLMQLMDLIEYFQEEEGG